MSDDSFFREVDQEFRQDQMKAIWRRYGAVLISIAVAVVLITTAIVIYLYWMEQRANAAGDAFSAALEQANTGENEAALAALGEIEAEGAASYQVLARMRMAALEAESGDPDAAVAWFDEIAADTSAPSAIRDMARLRAAYLLVDHGTYDDVGVRVQSLAGDDAIMRHAAREALGLAAWKAGESADALDYFGRIADDEAAPANIRQRSEIMSELIRGSGAGS